MLVTLVNLRRSTVSVSALKVSLAPSATKSVRLVRDLTEAELKELDDLQAAGHISLAISGDPDTQDEFEDAQLSTLNATLVRSSIIDTPNPAAGVDIAQAGFALIDGNGNPVRAQYLMEFAVFDDVNLVALASNATLNTIAKGTIVSGAGTNALRVITDANGEFECTLTDLVDPETVYVNASSGRGSPTIDGREIDAISFS